MIIIGAGPAGASAAIYTARAGLSTLVLYRAEADGALGVTQQIETYPGIRGPISGYELLKLIREHAKAFGAEYVRLHHTHHNKKLPYPETLPHLCTYLFSPNYLPSPLCP